ncbi:MAG: Hsp70 family protein, partial [Alteraurantiacibacter sp.]|nr:Hsp70 family protein [Alteraurantiacibacter sp.]
VHATEKQLAENGDKVDPETRAAVEAAIADVKAALAGNDTEAISAKAAILTEAAMKMGQQIYEKEQAAAQSSTADAGAAKADEGVVDAEFTEVDEDTKG